MPRSRQTGQEPYAVWANSLNSRIASSREIGLCDITLREIPHKTRGGICLTCFGW